MDFPWKIRNSPTLEKVGDLVTSQSPSVKNQKKMYKKHNVYTFSFNSSPKCLGKPSPPHPRLQACLGEVA